MTLYKTIKLILSILIIYFPSIILAQLQTNAPWPMFNHDIKHTSRSPYRFRDSGTGTIVRTNWKFKTGGAIYSSPSISQDQTIYIGSSDGYLYSINLAGKTNWRRNTGASIWNAPAIDKSNKIYIGSQGNRTLYCFNSTGKTNWTYTLLNGQILGSSPVINNKNQIIIANDNSPGYIYCISNNGHLSWESPTGGGITSSPALDESDNIYIGGRDNFMYCLKPNGKTNWHVNLLGGGVQSSPALSDDGKLFIGNDGGIFCCLNITNGNTNWRYTLAGASYFSSSAIGYNNRVYIGNNNDQLYCFDPNTGAIIWSCITGGDVNAAPTIDKDDKIYVGSYDDYLYCFNPDGSTNWKILTGANIQESTAVIGPDSKIYVGCNDSYLYCFKFNDLPILSNITITAINNTQANIKYDLIDLDQDICKILIQYSVDNGNTWNNANITGQTNNINLGTGKTLIWNYSNDGITYNQQNIKLKIIAHDAYENSSPCIINFFVSKTYNNLDDVIIVPNPFKPDANNNTITFYNLTSDAEIKIYTITGRLVVILKETDGDGKYTWNAKDSHGKLLPPGVYMCHVTNSKGQKKYLQLMIKR